MKGNIKLVNILKHLNRGKKLVGKRSSVPEIKFLIALEVKYFQ